MRDVQSLRELILGLSIITPLGCQSAPRGEAPAVEQVSLEGAEGRGAAAAEAPPQDPAAELSEVVSEARARVAGSRRVSTNLAHYEGQELMRARQREEAAAEAAAAAAAASAARRRCFTYEQLDDANMREYERQRRLWEEQERRLEQNLPLKRSIPPAGPLPVKEPVKPRKTSTCPVLPGQGTSPRGCGVPEYRFLGTDVSVDGGTMCCYEVYEGRPCGRLYYVEEQATRAQTREDDAWMGAREDAPGELGEALANDAARAWLEDALEEHASVAAFSRATLELMALGAPAELLAEYQRASLDEIEHARACFSLVGALSGGEVSAGALEVEGPRSDLEVIIEDVFWGGCVGESVAALCARRALRGCTWAPARRALEMIAGDEARHAALAWSTLSFLGEVAPARVRHVLERATPPAWERGYGLEDEAAWAALGRLTPAQDARAARDAWEHLIAPMLAGLLERA